ncbi:outer membrane protein assembly factor BamD [Flavobacterium sp.]
MKNIYIVFAFIALFSACSPYQKALKSEDISVKFTEASNQYEAGKYNKAIRLFEQIAPAYKGKPSAEKMFYLYAQSLYKTKQYYTAAYQFESFAASYPKSEKMEEASFLGAKCFSKLSPVYSLDQVDTYKAIEKLQSFIDRYPNSTFMDEANLIAKELREKLEKKAFEIAKQFNTISDYKSSMVAFDNFIINYPGTRYKEQALFYKLDSAYQLAINSVPAKMEERMLEAKAMYNNLIKFNNSSEYKDKADLMLARIDNDLKQFSKIN